MSAHWGASRSGSSHGGKLGREEKELDKPLHWKRKGRGIGSQEQAEKLHITSYGAGVDIGGVWVYSMIPLSDL